jgi:predicted aspartyl protease
VDYDFAVRMTRDEFNQYIVTMVELDQRIGVPGSKELTYNIPFVFDTGATYTLLNKYIAESRGWRIFQTGLVLHSYSQNGATLVCDLRKIPRLAFGIKQIEDLVVATPKDDNEEVANLLGRSFIDNFIFGVDQDKKLVYFKERNVVVAPDFSYSQIAHSQVLEDGATE